VRTCSVSRGATCQRQMSDRPPFRRHAAFVVHHHAKAAYANAQNIPPYRCSPLEVEESTGRKATAFRRCRDSTEATEMQRHARTTCSSEAPEGWRSAARFVLPRPVADLSYQHPPWYKEQMPATRWRKRYAPRRATQAPTETARKPPFLRAAPRQPAATRRRARQHMGMLYRRERPPPPPPSLSCLRRFRAAAPLRAARKAAAKLPKQESPNPHKHASRR